MKKFLLIVLFSFSLSGFAQENNFLVSSSKLIWENVFISSETNIPNLIARHSRLKITSANDAIYKGKGIDVRNTCPGTSDFLKDDLSFDFEIELRDGKYRVTITNLLFAKKNKKQKATTPGEKYLLSEGEVKTDDITNADLICLENYFTKLFSMNTAYKSKS